MKSLRSSRGMQQLALRLKCERRQVAFVPTMGYLHEGHASLIRRAREEVGPEGIVIVSIYVNPTQFAANEDLSKYPRDLPRDKKVCREAGADYFFNPPNDEIYTPDHSVYVVEETLTLGMEGASRPTHFRGVATIVAKLFNLTLPDVAVFGAKDFQQAAVITRMVRDLNFPIRVIVAPTIRENDGLAMSSRNKYLSESERDQALALWSAIQEARRRLGSSPSLPAKTLKEELRAQIEKHPSARVDYIEFFDPETMRPVEKAQKGTQMALAVFVGKTRLIDNARL